MSELKERITENRSNYILADDDYTPDLKLQKIALLENMGGYIMVI